MVHYVPPALRRTKDVMVETSVNAAGDFVFHLLRPDNSTTLIML